MNGKEHFWYGVLFEFVILLIMFINKITFNLENILWLIIIMFISPLLPDLDHREGKLREILTLIGIISIIVGLLINIILIKIGALILIIGYIPFYLTKHRGFLHSIPFSLAYGIVIGLLLEWQIGIIALSGCLSHLWLDRK